MVTTDDVTQAASTALAHVEHKNVAAGHEIGCSVDHLEIARLGIAEGLKLALQMLREQPGATKTLEVDNSGADTTEPPNRPSASIGQSTNGR